ncbi:Rab GTPase activator and protein kinase, putative [Plasmodium knowlesi strain H]|uniref:Rab GTPase activator and protein kinase, putative n=3 Tax=Plasmodium knowlesi TaxID=5850 RepID=A0A5K1UWP9_PLAKH|nr:Rab GTPase activator and protein kinase, putative [Plasmodium knowlesi strain H]OTN68553.1 putative Rab GTPase activator and protein kinase [Plasmodium knowlesi]CAA9986619.1 Rab GTPase activator and protein kinase, putative [Plasmodium knowlesi strain H]SBO24103.1 Rab GTPase activator and protein kinase, putative [Plasmodium knowlesi strain H]SBO29330.1 Rab GTPase activator and protein kinase, putative [Plasmodium knowlesi strain H]VVS76093.1 Rab GTPase activator and protein kinase, putativ|eukprot:XP_002261159.1 hypothetical protein, conserved in Plasmodium species [Plasmodium knowlesi strain H]
MFHERCQSSEFLLGIQSYSLDEGKRKRKKKRNEIISRGREDGVSPDRIKKTNPQNKLSSHQNKYSEISSKFEKVKSLNHPNVCSYFSLCRREDNFVLVSEYYSLSLYDLLGEEEMDLINFKCVRSALNKGCTNQGGAYTHEEGGKCCSIFPQWESISRRKLLDAHCMKKIIQHILSAVDYLHSRGIKLFNLTLKDILITPNGGVKVHNYCMFYLFGSYACDSRDRCDNFFKSTLGWVLPPFEEGTITKVKGEEDGEKNRYTQMSISRADKRFVSNPLYCPPFLLFNDLANAKRKVLSSKYDVFKHVDIFNVGIIILQLVNGIFDFNFLLRNCECLCGESVQQKNPRLNELHEVLETLRRIRQDGERAAHPNGRRIDVDETSLYIDKRGEGEGTLEKMKTIFVFLLYTKAYLLFANVDATEEVSLLDMNVYTLFRAFGDRRHREGIKCTNKRANDGANDGANANVLNYRVVKNLIELLVNVNVSVRFVKWVEKMLSEFFTLHVLKQNMEKIMHGEDAEKEKIFLFNLLYKCLSLRGDGQHASSSLLSHPYFYPRGANFLMKQWTEEQLEASTSKKEVMTYQGDDSPHCIKNNNHVVITPLGGGTPPNCISHLKEENKFDATHYNPYVVEYIRSNVWEGKLESKHFITMKDIHLWFGMLYKIDYFKELLYLNGVNRACNILKLPYIAYRKKKQFYEFYFLRFFKLLLLGRYQGVLNVYSNFVKGNSNVRCSRRSGIWGSTYRRMKCRADLFTRGTCTNGYTFSVKGKKFHIDRKNKISRITHPGVIFTGDKISEKKWIQTNTYPSDGMTITKQEEHFRDVIRKNLTDAAMHEEGIAHSFFFNIPTEENYISLPLRDCGGRRVLGVRLVEFYDALEDAYRLVQSKMDSGEYDQLNKLTCTYEKYHSFLHQYSLHLKLQKLLTLDPLNKHQLPEEVKRGFPSHMRGVAYLTLLGYRYCLLVRQAPRKKKKMRQLICEAHSRGVREMSIKRSEGRSPLGCLAREMQNDNSSESFGSKGRIYQSSGNMKETNEGDHREGDAEERNIHNEPFDIVKSSLKIFLRKRKRYNDLVGSPQFAKRMLTVELLLSIKLGVRNKHLRSLLLPLCLLYYHSSYLCYKCSKRVVQKYLLDLYVSENKWREFAYTFNCLLSYYAPELNLFFFKNHINVEKVVYSWVCSLFANFFDAEKFFFLLDRILTEPRCYLFFVSLSILIYLKGHIFMNMCRQNFYKDIFSLASLVNVNFLLKTSMDMFRSCPIPLVQFPRVGNNLREERNTEEEGENPNRPMNLVENERAHINYLSYLIGDANWIRYYVHRDTFRVYWKKGVNVSPCKNSGNVSSCKNSGNVSSCKNSGNVSSCKNSGNGANERRILIKKGLVSRTSVQGLKEGASKIDKLKLEKLKLKKIKRKKLIDDNNWGESGDFANLLSPGVTQEDQSGDAQMANAKIRSVEHHWELFLRNYKVNKKKKNLSEFSHYETDVVRNYKYEDKEMGEEEKLKNKNSGRKCVYYKLTNKKIKKRFKRDDLVRLCNFPMFPFVYVTDLANELSLDKYIIIDMRSPEEFKKKKLKHSVHVNTFLNNFKKGVYINYTDGSYDVDTHLKTIILAFNSSTFDFDAIYNFLNLKIKRITILWGGLHCAFSGLPASCFT